MPLDLSGITNENEFYASHYLEAVLERDLRGLLKVWGRKQNPPWDRLRRLKQPFFQACLDSEQAASPEERLGVQRRFLEQLLAALDYGMNPRLLDTSVAPVPLLSSVRAAPRGPARLLVVEAFGDRKPDLVQMTVDARQDPNAHKELTLGKLINNAVFFDDDPPRWVLVASLFSLTLFDRSKWSGRRALHFDWSEILARNDLPTLKTTAALLHRSSLCPDNGVSLLDALSEQSHKHAHTVSQDLKYALREAIELLGNETVRHLRTISREGVYGKDLADTLTGECLRYMYRLLFLFYIEARPELGYLPLKSKIYRKGYSLEKLRELELVDLSTDKARNGLFFDISIRHLFRMLYCGFDGGRQGDVEVKHDNTFKIAPLKSHLFDPDQTPMLDRVRVRNHIWQRIIRMMSLSTGHGRQTGRISYAQLGINQLGAVYEGLLSYRGFFAERDLYEVKKAKSDHDVLSQAYFVSAEQIEDYDDNERVYNEDGTSKVYVRGSFVYRLAGRDREMSASYYTPEVLTRCVVRYALREVLPDKTADALLGLTICEPALGSAAFLNEALSQLADAYLRRKQKEKGETLLPDMYAEEKQKVKMLLADNNVYGVDLNPVAVELAEVSLWLGTLVPGGFVPWFGNQLKCGNSLVGAWRRVYPAAALRKRTWWKEAPAAVPFSEARPAAGIYHFLVGDSGMATYTDRVIKQLVPDELRQIAVWRKAFTRPHTAAETLRLERLSAGVDLLWQRHAADLRRLERQTTDGFDVYGQPPATKQQTTTREKDRILEEALRLGAGNAGAYRRLKLVMDYWCALWFWPIEEAHLLPARGQYLSDMELLLTGKEALPGPVDREQLPLFAEGAFVDLRDELGFVDLDRLTGELPRLVVVQKLVRRYRFHHWQLEYADLFADRGGFDVVLGNPPWVKVAWKEGGVMGDLEPELVLRKVSASDLVHRRASFLENRYYRERYMGAYEAASGTKAYLNAPQNYPLLRGTQTNLYKCFVTLAWELSTEAAGLLHPEGVYDDAKGQRLRRVLYRRVRGHYQFVNQLMLFPEIGHRVTFSVNIYGKERRGVGFDTMANLFHPETVEAAYEHDGYGPVPGIKTDANKWDLSGHRERIVPVGGEELALFARLYGGVQEEAKLPAVHSRSSLGVMEKLASYPRKVRDLEYMSHAMWHETNAQKDGTIQRATCFPASGEEIIYSGPHFFVGNPFYKTPNPGCRTKADYSVLDLTTLPADYRPRCNYVPACSKEEYTRRIPRLAWDNNTPITDKYRVVFREMIGPAGERTLIPAIVPPGAAYIHTITAGVFGTKKDLVAAVGGLLALPCDFATKISGKAHLHDAWSAFPVPDFHPDAASRVLGLVCLTEDYAALWNAFCDMEEPHPWSKKDPRLGPAWFTQQAAPWSAASPLRSDYARRQALVELDVLFAKACGITLEGLQVVYRTQFPVMRHCEHDTWYDRKGRIVFTSNKGLSGVGLPRTRKREDRCYSIHSPTKTATGIPLGWEDVQEMQEGVVTKTFPDTSLTDEPQERTIAYHAPFDRCNREEDYNMAWGNLRA